MRDTGVLTLLEHGAYRTLLDHYYCEEILPNDMPRLQHLCRATTPEEKKAVEYVVKKYFSVEGDRLINPRADKEIILRREFIEKQSIKGRKSGEVRASNRGSTVVEPDVNLPSPSPLPSLDLSQSQKQRIVTRPKGNGRFTIPTIDDVTEFIRARKANVDPVKFHAHYTANGWKVGKNPMKNWKAAVVTWERN